MASENDTVIILNPGVGGDVTDATAVTDPTGITAGTIKRERIVLTGDQARAALAAVLSVRDGTYGLNVGAPDIKLVLEQQQLLLTEIRDLLQLIAGKGAA